MRQRHLSPAYTFPGGTAPQTPSSELRKSANNDPKRAHAVPNIEFLLVVCPLRSAKFNGQPMLLILHIPYLTKPHGALLNFSSGCVQQAVGPKTGAAVRLSTCVPSDQGDRWRCVVQAFHQDLDLQPRRCSQRSKRSKSALSPSFGKAVLD